ncbi:MAG: methyltransferase domain-containing protein [Alphaproteobacteria bacterium]|nr:methyltransferase domain-containing protein [Alphaproteobacteria bacterium]
MVKQSHLSERMRAWWDGYYYEAEEEPEPEPEEELPEFKQTPFKTDRQAAAWSDPRLQVAEEIWGKGHWSPGGDDEVEALIRPLNLDSSMTIVDFGAALGGTTRALHKETGAWVSGFEASPLLAEAGAELSQIAGLQKKASVEPMELKKLDLRESSFNAVFSKEVIFAMDEKENIFKKFYDCLRTDGQLLITDYLATKPDASGAAVDEWIAKEPVRPNLWSLEQTRSFIADLGFEVRITEDVTPTIRKQILSALGKFTAKIDMHGTKERGWGPAILAEIELWANRIKALESGEMAVFRIYGRKYDPSLK